MNDSPPPLPPIAPEPLKPPAASAGALARDCLQAYRYLLQNPLTLAKVFGLMLIVPVLNVMLFSLALMVGTMGGRSCFVVTLFLVFLPVTLWLGLVLGGYLWRCLADIVGSVIRGEASPPASGDFQPSREAYFGCRAIGLTLVYIFPILTLPLLPLALVALGHTGDGRCLSPIWAIRAAARRPKHWLALAGVSLLWYAVSLLIAGGVYLLAWSQTKAYWPPQGAIEPWWLVCFLVATAIGAAVNVALCYCAGRAGHSCPEILDLLPVEPNVDRSIGWGFGGLLASGAVFGLLMTFLARPLANYIEELRDPDGVAMRRKMAVEQAKAFREKEKAEGLEWFKRANDRMEAEAERSRWYIEKTKETREKSDP